MRELRPLEAAVQKVVQEALDDVASRFASDVAASAAPRELVAQGEPIDDGALARLAANWGEWRPAILAALLDVYQAGTDSTGRRYGDGPLPDFADLVQRWQDDPVSVPAQVQQFLTNANNRLDDVGDNLWASARQVLADGVAEGEGYDQLRDRLREEFARDGVELGESRAERIARTEVQEAWEVAARDAVRTLPDDVRPGYKTWLSTLDVRTRSSHWGLDGKTVRLDEQFDLGGVPVDGPMDPSAPIEQRANCRCDLAFGDDPADLPALGEDRQYLDDEQISEVIDHHAEQGVTRDSATAATGTLNHSAAGTRPGVPTQGTRMPDPLPPELIAAARAHDGAMIALVPTADDQQRLALPGGEPVDQLHLTLAYLGQAADWTPRQRDAATTLLRQAGLPSHPIEGNAFGAAHWNPDSDNPAWVLNVGGEDLDGVHSAVWETLRNAQGEVPLPIPDQHTPWNAHLCVAYSGDTGLLGQMEQRLGPIRFDRLRLAFAGENTDIPLRRHNDEDDEDEDDMPEPAVTAADDARPTRRWSTPGETALAFEDTQTGDGRVFALGALYWEGAAWPLQFADEMHGGHEGAELAGAIESMARDGRRLTGAGVLYPDTEAGAAVVELLERDAPLGVSVDLDDVDIELVDTRPAAERDAEPLLASTLTGLSMSVLRVPGGGYRVRAAGLARSLTAAGVNLATGAINAAAGDPDDPDGDVLIAEESGDLLLRITRGRVRGATLVSMPAYSEARIVLDAPGGIDALSATPVTAADPAEVPLGELMMEIIDYVTTADHPVRPGQVAEALAIPGTTARTYLSRAVAAGRLHRPARGLYTTTTPAGPDVAAAVVGDVDLPIHPNRDRDWDGGDAASRVLRHAEQQAEDSDDPPARWLRQAFLYEDPDGNPNTLAAYKLGMADAINGELRIVARGVFATAGGRGVDAADIPAEEADQIRARICELYQRIASEFDDPELVCPWERDEEAAADHMVASAWAEFDALPPMPAAWFAEPTEQEVPPGSGGMHITDDGRIYGWVAQRGVPHEGFPGRHLTIDDLKPIDTSFFLRKKYRLDDGNSIPLGPFVMNVGHHRDGGNCETQACLWDDSKTIAGLITVGFNDRGMWFSGASAPWLSQWDQAAFLACQPSYHMVEKPGGGYKLGSVLAVPRPGHPSRLAASAFIARSNMALTPAPRSPVSTTAAAVPVQPVDVHALAVAVVDEQERRAAARAEVEAMNAELAEIRAEVAKSMLAEIQGGP